MKICVLQPDYSTSKVDYQNYDPKRDLSDLYPEAQIDHVVLNKLTTYKQLKALSTKAYDIFVNLCEGYLEWEVPSIDVIYTLDLLNLPYTGPTLELYDPPKELMKYVAHLSGINVPNYTIVRNMAETSAAAKKMQFPLFVKPAKAGDSLGIDHNSKIHTEEDLLKKVRSLIKEYDDILIEEYIPGREFTVLIAAHPDDQTQVISFKPVEYIFPEGFAFKTYSLKTSELHDECNVPVKDPKIEHELRESAIKIFKEFGGKGYGRIDFRMNDKGELFFLEINFTCSVFYSDGYEGSADHILKFDGIGQTGFLKLIIAEGINRHKRKQQKFYIKKDAISGYGIYAKNRIRKGEIVFQGEEKSQRIVTKSYVEQNWNDAEQETFRRYAYPISDEVFILWDTNPSGWAPQNHSCNANTKYIGLNVIAARDIKKDEELSLDYAQFINEEMEPFECSCGASNCRKFIQGSFNNTVTDREKMGALIVKS